MAVKPNEVYIILPYTKMLLSEGVLHLSPREKLQGKYMPGNAFLSHWQPIAVRDLQIKNSAASRRSMKQPFFIRYLRPKGRGIYPL